MEEKTKAKEVSAIEFVYGLIIGIVIAVIGSIISFRQGVEHRKRVAEAAFESAEKESQRIIIEAEKVAERKSACSRRTKPSKRRWISLKRKTKR